MKLVYLGLPLAALTLFEDGHELLCVALSPARAPGRRRLLRRVPADRVIDARGLEACEVARRLGERLEAMDADLLVSWFWSRRIPMRWLERCRFGGINLHPSLLPRHRGPDPYFAAVDAGDAASGVTVHRLAEGYDEGDVLLQAKVVVESRNAWQLARALDAPGLCLLRRAVRALACGEELRPHPQDAAAVTWAPRPDGELLRVDWRWPSERVLRRIRALAPAPGLALDIEGLELVVTDAAPAHDYPRALEPGEAAALPTGSAVVIRTGDGAVMLLRAFGEDPSTTGAQARDEEPAALGPAAIAAALQARLLL